MFAQQGTNNYLAGADDEYDTLREDLEKTKKELNDVKRKYRNYEKDTRYNNICNLCIIILLVTVYLALYIKYDDRAGMSIYIILLFFLLISLFVKMIKYGKFLKYSYNPERENLISTV